MGTDSHRTELEEGNSSRNKSSDSWLSIAHWSSLSVETQFGINVVICLVVLFSYIPVRLVAEHTNGPCQPGSDNFLYWPAMFFWPLYSFQVAFVPHCCARLLNAGLFQRSLLLFVLFLVWCIQPFFDFILPVTGIGAHGFHYFPRDSRALNTQWVSAFLCPIAFFIGVGAGECLGGFLDGRLRKAPQTQAEES